MAKQKATGAYYAPIEVGDRGYHGKNGEMKIKVLEVINEDGEPRLVRFMVEAAPLKYGHLVGTIHAMTYLQAKKIFHRF